MISKIIPKLFFTCYLLIHLFIIFEFGSLDKSNFQWLIVSCLLLFHSYYNYRSGYFEDKVSLPIFFLFIILIQGIISITYAFNYGEVLIESARFGTIFLVFYNSYLTIKNDEKIIKFIFSLICISVFLETAAIFVIFLEISNAALVDQIGRNPIYKGLAGNINIAGFSIVSKLPFLIYFINKSKNVIFKLSLYLLLCLSFFCVALTGSRGALLAIYCIIIFYIGYSVYRYYITSSKKTLFSSLRLIIPFAISSLMTELLFITLKTSYRTGEIFIRGSESRIRYWLDALNSIADQPLLGVGLGNWKIFSILYNQDYLRNYVVPYHAHNDFLQLVAELGVFAGLLAILFFFIPIRATFLNLKFKDSKKLNVALFSLLFVIVYLIDSMLNFPINRPINVLTFCVVFAVMNVLFVKGPSIRMPFNSLVLLVLLFSINSYSIYFNQRNFKSSIDQKNLFVDYNANNFDDSISTIDEYEDEIPSITATALPIKGLKAHYYMDRGRGQDAIDMLKRDIGTKDNPFIGFYEGKLSSIYNHFGKYDSAYKYSKIAYQKLPNNLLHAGNLMLSIWGSNKNFDEANQIFEYNKKYYEEPVWEFYMRIISSPSSNFNKDSLPYMAGEARKHFPQNEAIRLIYFSSKYGLEKIDKANSFDSLANYYFDNRDFQRAFQNYKAANEILPEDYAYLQNMGISKTQTLEYEEALSYFNFAIDSLVIPDSNGRIYALRAASKLVLNDRLGACDDLKIGVDKKDELSIELVLQNCQDMIKSVEYIE